MASRLGHYDLVRPLAHGGMADLFLARDRRTGDACAVKVLAGERAEDADAGELFLHEGRLVQLLVHDNIAAVYAAEIEPATGVHYLAMEWVHGADLREVANTAMALGRPVDWPTALSIVCAAGAGLDHAHRATGPGGRPLELVHRDVSLSNIMIGHDGSVKLVDFGIARTAMSTVATAPGVVRGKASYMAPEQCLGDKVDRRTDVFALGIVLYELTTGGRCFGGDNDFDRMMAIVRGEFAKPRERDPEYPEDLESVVLAAMGTRPDERFQSVAAMCAALARVGERNGWALGPGAIRDTMSGLYGSKVGDETLIGDSLDEPSVDVIIPIEPLSVDIVIESAATTDTVDAAADPGDAADAGDSLTGTIDRAFGEIVEDDLFTVPTSPTHRSRPAPGPASPSSATPASPAHASPAHASPAHASPAPEPPAPLEPPSTREWDATTSERPPRRAAPPISRDS